MRTQTKSTIIICCLFIVEIFPVPFTSVISLFVIRKRPAWFSRLVTNLYADKPAEENLVIEKIVNNNGGLPTRTKCTIAMSFMFVIDLIVPVTIPTALYVSRKRPNWLINVARRLYDDDAIGRQGGMAAADLEQPEEVYERQVDNEAIEQKLLDLERNNLRFARAALKRS